MITMQEIKETKTEDLRAELTKLSAELRAHRFGVSIQQERNIAQRTNMRRTVARIKTELAARAAKNA